MHDFPMKQVAEGSEGHALAAQGVCNWSFGGVSALRDTRRGVTSHFTHLQRKTWEDEELSDMVWMLSVILLSTAARVVLKQ